MPDIKYEVVVEYKLGGDLKGHLPQLGADSNALASAIARSRGETKELGAAQREAAAAAKELGHAFTAAGSSAASFFTGAVEKAGQLAKTVGMVAVGAGLGAATYGVMHLNAELEQTQLSLAAVFNSQGYAHNFIDSMGIARGEIEKMKVEVKQLPGTFTQLANIMQEMAIPGAQAGMDPDRLRKLAEKTMLFAGVNAGSIDMNQAGGSMGMLLGGMAYQRNPLARLLGFNTKGARDKLRTESGEDRVKDIEKALSKYDAAAEAFSHTWRSVSTTFKDDVLLSLLAPITSPLFESVKRTLVASHDWFGANEADVSIFVGRLGDGLAHAWERGTNIFKEWAPAVRTFAQGAYSDIAAIWKNLEPVVERIGGIIKDSLSDGSALKRLESILKMYGAIKIGGAVGGAVSPAIGAAWKLAGLGGGAAQAVAAGEGAAGGAELGIAALGGAAAVGALAAAAATAGGELLALTDASSKYHDEAVASAGQLSKSWGDVASSASTIWDTDLKPFFEKVGVEGTQELNKFFYGLQGILNPAKSGLINPDDSVWDMFADTENADKNAEARRKFRLGLRFDVFNPNYADDPLDFTHSSTPGAGDKNAANKPKATAGGNVTINNYFSISSNHDPSRIARDVVSEIASMRRSPTQSRHVRNPQSMTSG